MAVNALSAKQQRLVEEYLVDCNGTQAAIRAGYSKKTANEQAARLLAKVSIQNAIAERRSKLAAKVAVTQEMVVRGLLAEAQCFTKEQGASAGARVAAWTQLGRHLGLFERDNAQLRSPLEKLPRDVLDDITEKLNSFLTESESAGGGAGTHH